MADLSYLGHKKINSDTTIKGDVVVTGSLSTTGAIRENGVALATLDSIQNMVIYDESLNTILNFDYVSTSDGDIVVHKIG
jgi:hypothetical protein|tara:strand:+ start:2454 stop:2693 length:240 start_codon:yes stop_codon:yes gene_type:complete